MEINYELALQLCLPQRIEKGREWLSHTGLTPDGAIAFGTDSKIMAFIDSKLAPGVVHYDGPITGRRVDIRNVFPSRWFDEPKEISTAELRRVTKQFKMVPETIWVGKDIHCMDCKGSGSVESDYTAKSGAVFLFDNDCPICDGSGYLEESTKKETGRRLVFDSEQSMMIGDCEIGGYYVQLLIDVIRQLGNPDTIFVDYQNRPDQATTFRIHGLRVMIMPIYGKDDENRCHLIPGRIKFA